MLRLICFFPLVIVCYSALREATKKRGIVVSRSTYPSSGHYGGSWLGDNESKWSNLHDSIIGNLDFFYLYIYKQAPRL